MIYWFLLAVLLISNTHAQTHPSNEDEEDLCKLDFLFSPQMKPTSSLLLENKATSLSGMICKSSFTFSDWLNRTRACSLSWHLSMARFLSLSLSLSLSLVPVFNEISTSIEQVEVISSLLCLSIEMKGDACLFTHSRWMRVFHVYLLVDHSLNGHRVSAHHVGHLFLLTDQTIENGRRVKWERYDQPIHTHTFQMAHLSLWTLLIVDNFHKKEKRNCYSFSEPPYHLWALIRHE